ncbi:MAG: hypothetical protein HUU55_05825 [Myxococcales bacterium]|nr:hypothetical protein [Myxococcales bacterium]
MNTNEFTASADEHERFVQQLLARRYGRVEVPVRPGLAASGTALALAGVSLVTLRLDSRFAPVLLSVAAISLMVAFYQWRKTPVRVTSLTTAEPDVVSGNAERMNEERILGRAPAGGRVRREVRYAGGIAQLVWGISVVATTLVSTLLPGMTPLAAGYLAWMSGLMVIGCLMIGRAIRDVTSLSPAVEVILTNQRLLFVERKGFMASLPLEQIRLKPVVVERLDHSATLGVELRPLPAVSPLPVKALWGVDVMTPEDARQWAQWIVDARRLRIATQEQSN